MIARVILCFQMNLSESRSSVAHLLLALTFRFLDLNLKTNKLWIIIFSDALVYLALIIDTHVFYPMVMICRVIPCIILHKFGKICIILRVFFSIAHLWPDFLSCLTNN